MEKMDVGSEETNDKTPREEATGNNNDDVAQMLESENDEHSENENNNELDGDMDPELTDIQKRIDAMRKDPELAKVLNKDIDYEDEPLELEVAVHEVELARNPYDYTAHMALINTLQKMGELERLRVARENMSTKFPLTATVWLSWIRDEIKLATTPEQKAEVVKLCERAVKDYLSVEVWLEYLQFSIGNMGTEIGGAKNVRQLFERALTAVGLHTIKGAIIWEAFREFETVLHALIDPSKNAERKEQLDRIANLFRRQLSCPLLDMEKTLEEYEAWRTGDGTEAVIDEKIVMGGYERALAKLNVRLPFEEKIVSAHDTSEILYAYKAYLLNEKQNGDPGRITVLYERAITDACLETTLWVDYLTYLEENLKIETLLEQVYGRASRNVPWCATIWRKWIRSYEKWGKPVVDVQKLFESALEAGITTVDDSRHLWLTYLEYLRRRIDQHPDDEVKQLNVLRNTFNRACEHLAQSFGLHGDPNCIILQFWARTEAVHANDMERFRSLWSDILSQGHSETASYWMEYISLERCYGSTKHLRKLYQKALSSVKDWPETIANSWMDFERDEGNLEQMEICEAKTKEKLDAVMEERHKTQQVYSYNESPSPTKKGSKRKPDEAGRWKNLGGLPQKFSKIESKPKPKVRESNLNLEKKSGGDAEATKTKIAPPPGFKPPEDETMDVESTHEVDDKITVFISNLDYTATEEEIRDALEPAGPISLFKMIQDYKGRSKGYCYVQLSSPEAVDKALTLDRTPIRGRPMFVSRCDPDRATRKPGFKYNSSLEKNKLFVKGLPVNMTKEQLEDIFKVHGVLKDVRLVTYRNGHSKGLAYVEFEDEASAAKALLATDQMNVEDKVITVAISQPPERKKIPANDEITQIRSLGGTTASRSTFGVPKTLLSMIPRTVKPVASNNSATPSGNGVAPKLNNQDFRKMFLSK